MPTVKLSLPGKVLKTDDTLSFTLNAGDTFSNVIIFPRLYDQLVVSNWSVAPTNPYQSTEFALSTYSNSSSTTTSQVNTAVSINGTFIKSGINVEGFQCYVLQNGNQASLGMIQVVLAVDPLSFRLSRVYWISETVVTVPSVTTYHGVSRSHQQQDTRTITITGMYYE